MSPSSFETPREIRNANIRGAAVAALLASSMTLSGAIIGNRLFDDRKEVATTAPAGETALPRCYDIPLAPRNEHDGQELSKWDGPGATDTPLPVTIKSKPGKMTPAPVKISTKADRQKLTAATVRIDNMAEANRGMGSGFIAETNKVITAAHVVGPARPSELTITNHEGIKVPVLGGCVIAETNGVFTGHKGAEVDVAVLTIADRALGSTALQLADSLPPRGDNSSSFRNYQGGSYTQRGYQGIMLGESRDYTVRLLTGITPDLNCEQQAEGWNASSTCALQAGGSGGPIVNSSAEVIAISNKGTNRGVRPLTKQELITDFNVVPHLPLVQHAGNYPVVAAGNTYPVLQFALASPRA